MIIVTETLSVYELASSHCVMNNKCLLYWEHATWATLTDAKKTEVLTWLSDYCDEDVVEAIKAGRNCCVEYTSEEVAVLNASEWFPPRASCPDADHYFRALVFDNNADIVFENLDPTTP